ncbi:MAG TPA: HPF/RaiA family ribosome-associated protein [Nocardioidaceae bacterium]|nr:HPF/RaiA family ribosome-associated protein [Nocardioidaceae bacterium]
MSVTAQPAAVEVTLRDDVGTFAGDYARAKIGGALKVADGRIRRAHVVLDWGHDPAVERPALAEVSVDVDGLLVRAKTAAPTMPEAIDALEDRLRRQLVSAQDRNRALHRWTGIASEHEWRHGDRPRRPLPYFNRPEETRQVVRRKSFAGAPITVDEAAYEMDLLDHDFYLYRDIDSKRPALVHRRPEGGYGVQGVDHDGTIAAVTYEPPPPSLTDAEARARLEANDERFVFYLDRDRGVGSVLYRRYDGHYGLIELAD